VLVVEIAETSLTLDREHKSGLYARAGVADYWIVNLREAVLEIYRQPEPSASRPTGWEYRSTPRLAPGTTTSPLAAPDRSLAVADLPPTGLADAHRRLRPLRRSMAAPQLARNAVMKACSFAGSTASGARASATASAVW
jgi:Putative restriction endonuclease